MRARRMGSSCREHSHQQRPLPSQRAVAVGVRALLCLTVLLVGAPARADETDVAKGHLQQVEALLDAWDIPGARRELDALAAVVPAGIEPLRYFQGRLAFEEGRYAEAVQLLEAAGVEDKPGSYLRLAKDTRDVVKDHVRAESEHFVFFYPKGKEQVLVPYALETLEAIHRALAQDLGHVPVGKVRVEVVNDARELARVSTLTLKQIQATGTIAICKFNKLMVTSPKAVARGYDWQDTLAHEYIHLVVSQMSRNTVPIWLHEGMAKFLESRWRGSPGQALVPSTLALLGRRVKANTLIPFEKMHPSIALLPTAEDAATAFAEVFFAVDYVHQTQGVQGLRTIITSLRDGKTDRQAVEAAVGMNFAAFERAWLAHIRKQPFPQELLPREQVVLKEEGKGKEDKDKDKDKGREISFGDFAEVEEVQARKYAHLGELLRARNRAKAAAEELGKAHRLVGDKYESVSNKYALTLLELRRLEEAEQVLRGSLRVHPGAPQTNVHLGRILLHRKEWTRAKQAYLEALAADPFDPEIHLALTRIHGVLGEGKLVERARSAAVLLTGLSAQQVEQIAQELMREEKGLSELEMPSGGKGGKGSDDGSGGSAPAAAQDGGRGSP